MRKRKTTLKSVEEKTARRYEKKMAEQEKKIVELEAQATKQPIPEKTEEKREARVISIVHKFRPNPLRFANYIELKPEFGYYWHDTALIERQGWGIWERVDKSNHTLVKNTRTHVDGSIRVGTAILGYASQDDIMAQRIFYADKSKSTLTDLEQAHLEEMERIFAEHGKQYGGIKGVGEKVEEKRY